MKNVSHKVAVILLTVAGVGLTTWLILRTDEPIYQGKPLTAWLKEYCADYDAYLAAHGVHADPRVEEDFHSEALLAIRAIGTNALPVLLRMARAKDHPIKARFLKALRKSSLFSISFVSAEDHRTMACMGFYALGDQGQDAVPDLMAILSGPDIELKLTAADCLGNIGPQAKTAVPSLLKLLDNTNRIVRWDATANLGKIRMEHEMVVPVLMTNLTTSNSILGTTISTLGEFGASAKPAVPALLKLLDHPDSYIRLETVDALKRIAPETVSEFDQEQ